MTLAFWLFALSGLAGLIYEVVWTRYLALFVGHSAFAQAIVLIVFLGGMAIGAVVVADRSARIRGPLRAYALVEGALGLLALAFHPIYQLVTARAYSTLLPHLGVGPGATLAQWGIAALLIIPQSVLMGMTFPLMSAAVTRRHTTQGQGAGHPIALLYFANSLGAAIGVLIAGFFLISRFGLHATLLVAGGVNLAIAAVAWRLAAQRERTEPPGARPVPAATAASPGLSGNGEQRVWLMLLATSAGTAVASYIYEIAWTRMLALVLGSATHAFELMLSAFILGLALGAFWIRRRADAVRDPIDFLARVQLAMGTLALATIPVYLALFPFMSWLVESLPKTPTGYLWFNIARYGLSLAVMLPATFCAGMTLPLISTVLLRHGHGERTVGAVYSVNSLGSIFGVGLGALVLMPLVGLRGLLVIGGGIDILFGVLLLLLVPRVASTEASVRGGVSRWPRGTIVFGLLACLTVGTAIASGRFDANLLASGVFRNGQLPDLLEATVIDYADGRTATVSVKRFRNGDLSIATNGKADASIDRFIFSPPDTSLGAQPALTGDASTQALLPLITLAHAPAARRAVVIGHGSGQSGHLLLAGPQLASLTTVEIEPEMLRASRYFAPVNWRVFKDPRSHFVVDDARAYFAGSPHRADLILSEPSNPWVSGVAGLFTVEFYRHIRTSLAADGVFGQWMHLYESSDAMVLSVLAAVHEVFGDYRVFLTDDSDILIVASPTKLRPHPDWSLFALPQLRQDLRWFRPVAREHLEASLLLDRETVAPLLTSVGPGRAEPNTDDRPRLDAAGERARFLDVPVSLLDLAQDRFDLPAALAGWIRPFGQSRWPTTGGTRSTFMAAAAALRQNGSIGGAPFQVQQQQSQLAHRLALLQTGVSTGAPPLDWTGWCIDALELEEALHSGTMGVVDSSFYRPLMDFARQQQAPDGILAALVFRQAVAGYDWPTAVAQIDRVVPAMRRNPPLMAPAMFRTAATVALLKVGQTARAATLFSDFRDAPGVQAGDVTSRLLAAHLARAQGMPRALAGPPAP